MSELKPKEVLMQDWPTALAICEPDGWAIYGGIEDELEMNAKLASGNDTEEEAWANALDYYNDMCVENDA